MKTFPDKLLIKAYLLVLNDSSSYSSIHDNNNNKTGLQNWRLNYVAP